ncbi:MAG: phosphoribosylglycinamide synthetase C domain-containing protein [Candidatus Poseidoniales archaeon]
MSKHTIQYHDAHALTVVLASEGYPSSAKTGLLIEGIDELERVTSPHNLWINHAATKMNEDGQYISTGGRVLSVTALGSTLQECYTTAYDGIERLGLEGSHYRKDIGKKAFDFA